MAADDLLIEYHLTPDGWIKGTRRFFRNIDGDEIPRPDNAVETWDEHIYQSSIYSNESITYSLVWHAPNVAAEDRRALRTKFKTPFTREPDRFLERWTVRVDKA